VANTTVRYVGILLAIAACKGGGNGNSGSTETTTTDTTETAAAIDAAVEVAKVAPPDAAPPPPPPKGCEMLEHAQALYAVAACGAGDLPADLGDDDKETIEKQCKDLHDEYSEYKTNWLDIATPYLANIVPDTIPQKVVYPFGGGDLLTALATFPKIPEITTVSLEPSGDVRNIGEVRDDKLASALRKSHRAVRRLMNTAWSVTDTLDEVSWGGLPGEMVMSFAALHVHGFQPVSLRYFQFEDDGSLDYIECDEMPEVGYKKRRPKGEWRHDKTILEDAFNNMEIQFRPIGDDSAPVRIHRHIAANLANDHLEKDGRVLKHLQAKGDISAMTKAAGYMLWMEMLDDFRDYMLANVKWMISDTTGIPSRYGQPAGFEYETYGIWTAMYHMYKGFRQHMQKEMRELWASQPHRELPFRYGYWDTKKRSSLMITRRAE
jgi:hypothetical protein